MFARVHTVSTISTQESSQTDNGPVKISSSYKALILGLEVRGGVVLLCVFFRKKFCQSNLLTILLKPMVYNIIP